MSRTDEPPPPSDWGRRLRELLGQQADLRRLEGTLARRPFVLLELDAHGRYTFCAGQPLAALGLSSADVVGRTVDEVCHDYPLIRAAAARALAGETVEQLAEFSGHLFAITFHPLRAAGRVVKVTGVAWDMTEQLGHGIEPAAARDPRVQDFATVASEWFWETDAELRFTWLSQRFQESTGLVPATLLGRRHGESRLDDPEADDWQAHLADLAARRPFRDFTHAIEGDGDARRLVRISGQPILDIAGRFIGYRGTGRDITRERQGERELREIGHRFRSLVGNLRGMYFCRGRKGDGPFGYDAAGVEVYGSDALLVTGTVGEGRTDLERWYEAIHPEDRPHYLMLEHRRKTHYEPYDFTFRLLHPLTGDLRWIREVAWVVEDHATGSERIYFDSYVLDVTEQKRVEATARDSEARFRSLVTNLRNIIFCRGAAGDGRFGYDPAGVEMFGVDAARLSGTNDGKGGTRVGLWYESIHPDDRAAYLEAERRRKEEGRLYDLEYRIVHPGSGEPRWMQEVAWVVEDDVSGRRYFDSYILDITERKQREVALDEARARLEAQAQAMRELAAEAQRASVAKSEFLAMMSHEIRTPMNAILGFAELLSSSPLSVEQRRHVDIIRGTGRQLLTVLNDVLDFSKLEAGRIEIEPAPVRLDELLHSTRPFTEMLLLEKAVAFSLAVEPGVPVAIRTDPVRLKQILSNFLSNAAKFTRQGSIRLDVEALGQEPDGRLRLRFAVTDTGIGIGDEQRGRLFQMFGQAEGSTRRFGGTGLGLAICRRLAEQMEGTIGVQSRPGQGSTFWVELPVEPVAPDLVPVSPLVARALAGAARQLDVLIVDDVETNRELIQALVRRAGHAVRLAGDGREALAEIGRLRPDLVLMDVNMPVLDGLSACRRLREDPANADLPVVALTAHAFSSDIEACRAAGMDGHLAKPIQPERLYDLLAHYGGIPAMSSSSPVPAEPPPAPADATAALDLAMLEGLMAKVGAERVTALVRRMLENAGREVAEMRESLARADAPALERAAHRLAGAGGSLGARRLGELARTIEQQAQQRRLQGLERRLDELEALRQQALAELQARMARS